MAQLSLGEAAKISGRNRTTIFRAMKNGRLSFTLNGAGERRIDAAELERVFPATDADNGQSNSPHVALLGAQLEAERARIALLERTTDDLRQRLDASEAERRSVQAQLTALLAAPLKSPPESPRTAWRRFLVWRRSFR